MSRPSEPPSDQYPTRLSLLDGARAGDGAAWERLVSLYGPLVLRWCRSLGLREDQAEDACQETFASVAHALGSFRRPADGAFRGWLLAIARNKVRDRQRRDGRQGAAEGGTEARERIEAAAAPDLDAEGSVESDRVEVLRRALALIRRDFDEKTWQAFWAAAADERPSAEVGAELALSANAVRKAKARVLRRLREEFGGLLPDL